MAALPPAIAAANWRAIADFDGRAALGQVQVPVLILGSPGTERGLRIGAGHFSQLEVPEQVNPMIGRFLVVSDLVSRAAAGYSAR